MEFTKAKENAKGANKVIIHLLENNLTLEEISQLNTEDISEVGIKQISFPPEIVAALAEHMSKNEHKYHLSPALFPSRKSPRASVDNLTSNLKNSLKQINLKLSDIGLAVSRTRPGSPIPANATMADIFAYSMMLRKASSEVVQGQAETSATLPASVVKKK